MTDLGDKINEDEKANIQSKIDALKEAVKTDNTDDIKAKTDELQKAFYDLSAKIYQQANPDGQGIDPSQFANMGGEAASPSDDGVVDADFTEV